MPKTNKTNPSELPTKEELKRALATVKDKEWRDMYKELQKEMAIMRKDIMADMEEMFE